MNIENSSPRQAAQPQSFNGKFHKSNRVLLDERPLVLLPSLAKAVGVNGAIVIQQLHFYLADPHNGRVHDGERWIFKSYDEWQRNDFSFWNVWRIQRIFRELETRNLILSCQPEGRVSRRKYYRIDYDVLDKAVKAATPAEVKATTRARAHAEHGKTARSMITKVHVPLYRDNIAETTHSLKRDTRAVARPSCFDLSDYSESELQLIETYHSIVCDNNLRWKRITRYTDTASHLLEPWTYDLDAFRDLCLAAVKENGDCIIPNHRTLVRLLGDNYG